MTPEETLAIKTLTLEKVRRTAQVLVSDALLTGADLRIVPDLLADNITRCLYTVEVLGKPEVSQWTERDALVTAPGIWNNVKAWLLLRWTRITERKEPHWMTPRTLPMRSTHHHTIYHMCPHINEWTDKNARRMHFKFLESTPVPPQTDEL